MARRLTPHQQNVYEQLYRLSRRLSGGLTRDSWVRLEEIGSRGGLDHLVTKGWAERREESGPRGGVRLSYRPTSRPWETQPE